MKEKVFQLLKIEFQEKIALLSYLSIKINIWNCRKLLLSNFIKVFSYNKVKVYFYLNYLECKAVKPRKVHLLY